MIQGRLATEKDIDRICEIFNIRAGFKSYTPEFVQNKLDDKGHCVGVVEVDNKVMGFAFDYLGVDTKDGKQVNEFTVWLLDPKWNPLNPLNKLTAMKALAAVFYKYAIPEKGAIARYRARPNTHLLIKAELTTIGGLTKVGTDNNGSEIFESEFDATKRSDFLASNSNLVK